MDTIPENQPLRPKQMCMLFTQKVGGGHSSIWTHTEQKLRSNKPVQIKYGSRSCGCITFFLLQMCSETYFQTLFCCNISLSPGMLKTDRGRTGRDSHALTCMHGRSSSDYNKHTHRVTVRLHSLLRMPFTSPLCQFKQFYAAIVMFKISYRLSNLFNTDPICGEPVNIEMSNVASLHCRNSYTNNSKRRKHKGCH